MNEKRIQEEWDEMCYKLADKFYKEKKQNTNNSYRKLMMACVTDKGQRNYYIDGTEETIYTAQPVKVKK